MSTLLAGSPHSCAVWKLKKVSLSSPRLIARTSGSSNVRLGINTNSCNNGVRAFFFNPVDERIVNEAFKEPVAFMGGIFAGILRLDLEEEPLKEWVTRTVEAAGVTEEELEAEGSTTETAPQQIEIE
ncbi:UPF0426 protein, chloroplastic [Quillaja saponaria]|uniref:UPF0426 protein, chloroplastic n=1 Tax=Quillaja saponaria TaxID=32244 RepID=A0AAD7VHC2_QUISA|nr:UPF0426 protein, chloroplastic [Quillaja saponaria]